MHAHTSGRTALLHASSTSLTAPLPRESAPAVGQQTGVGQQQTWQELRQAACIARWNGLCYAPTDVMLQTLRDDGLRVVSHGRSKFTSWFVADGAIDYSSSQRPALAFDAPDVPRQQQLLVPAPGSRPVASPAGAGVSELLSHPPRQQRFVCVRGVQWAAHDGDAVQLWQQLLLRAWPEPFAAALTTPPGALTAHAGAAGEAVELLRTLMPHLVARQAGHLAGQTGQLAGHAGRGASSQPQLPLVFSGHSLGGALAKLLWCLAHVNRIRPAEQLSCFTYGSPPVLAHRDGGGGARVLSVLGADASRCSNYVLGNDPVPRAGLSSDPTFHALKRSSGAVRGLLQLRSAIYGQGVALSSERFMYESVGRLLLLRPDAENGTASVTSVNEAQLRIVSDNDPWVNPQQYWDDHQQANYVSAIEGACAAAQQRNGRA